MPPTLSVDRSTARRFALLATGLVTPHADAGTALTHQGFVQIDPINVCGRMHEHILRPRVADYDEGGLHHLTHGCRDGDDWGTPVLPAEKRTAFEHFHPSRAVLATWPVDAWPHLLSLMARRARTPGQWAGKLTAPEKRLASRILTEITDRGALGSEHIDDTTRASNGWGNGRMAKVVMDKLLAHGRLLIARRLNGRRIYDLPERILPATTLVTARPSAAATARWIVELKLRQHRLVRIGPADLKRVVDLVQPLDVKDCPTLYILRSDVALLEAARDPATAVPTEPRLLAPLDPILLDRTIVQRLWDFDYTWEVYTPAAKRKRGYYALPLLAGDRLIGDVDLKADRSAGRLRVVSRRCSRGHKSADAVREVARFLGLK